MKAIYWTSFVILGLGVVNSILRFASIIYVQRHLDRTALVLVIVALALAFGMYVVYTRKLKKVGR